MSRDGKRARLPWLKSRFALLALVLAGTCLGCSQHTTAKKQTQIIEDPNRNKPNKPNKPNQPNKPNKINEN
jgi:hypothetical protein